eukprot:Clim_evm46s25 gene=Clim_evmTU46s25
MPALTLSEPMESQEGPRRSSRQPVKRVLENIGEDTTPKRAKTRNQDDQGAQNASKQSKSTKSNKSSGKRAATGPAQPAKRPARKQASKPAKRKDSFLGLFLEADAAVENTVADIIDLFKEKKSAAAVTELINFHLELCGCESGVSSAAHLEASEVQELMAEIVDSIPESAGAEYKLKNASAKETKVLRNNLDAFWTSLVQRLLSLSSNIHRTVIDDLAQWVIQGTLSDVRAVRHTSTFVAYMIMNGMVAYIAENTRECEQLRKTLSTEQKKTSSKKTKTDRRTHMEKQLESMEERNEVVWDILQKQWFSGTFQHRYRDSAPEIREMSLSCLSVWMLALPDYFFSDQFLKYIGWLLSDKAKEVRHTALESLNTVMQKGHLDRLRLFVEKFKARIVEMVNDIEASVAVEAMKTVELMNASFEDALSEEQIEGICLLVFCEDRGISRAGARHLRTYLVEDTRSRFIEDALDKQKSSRKAKGAKASRELESRLTTDQKDIVALASFMVSKAPDVQESAYYIDTLWNAFSAIKNYEEFVALLQSHDLPKISADIERTLVDMLVYSVKKYCGKLDLPGRRGTTKFTQKQQKDYDEKRRHVTQVVLAEWSAFLDRFSSDAEAFANLVGLVEDFDINLLGDADAIETVTTAVNLFNQTFLKHPSRDVILQISKAYITLLKLGEPLSSRMQASLHSLSQTVTAKLQTAAENEKEALYDVELAVSMAHALILHHSILNQPEILNHLLEIVKSRKNDSDDLVSYAVEGLVQNVFWAAADKDRDGGLAEYVAKIMEEIEAIVTNPDTSDRLMTEMSLSMCDLCITYNTHALEMELNVITPSNTVRAQLVQHVVDAIVFKEEEEVTEEALVAGAKVLACVFKMAMTDIMPTVSVAGIVAMYPQVQDQFQQVYREFFKRLREDGPADFAQLALEATAIHLEESNDSAIAFVKKLAPTFGIDNLKTRDAVNEVHKRMIKRAFGLIGSQDADVRYLVCVQELSRLLIPQDARVLLSWIDQLEEKVDMSLLADDEHLKAFKSNLSNIAATAPSAPKTAVDPSTGGAEEAETNAAEEPHTEGDADRAEADIVGEGEE